MSNSTTYTSLRQPKDISVADANATTLLSYFLLHVIQWILASDFLLIVYRVILIFATLGFISIIMGGDTNNKQKGLNNQHYKYTKKHV